VEDKGSHGDNKKEERKRSSSGAKARKEKEAK